MPYIRESALFEINQAQHDAVAQSQDLARIATRVKAGNIDVRDAIALERIAKKLDIFSNIITEPIAKRA